MLCSFPWATNAKHTHIALRPGDSDIYDLLSFSLDTALLNQREKETILAYHSLPLLDPNLNNFLRPWPGSLPPSLGPVLDGLGVAQQGG